MSIVCGIDPGVSGALAFYDTEKKEPVALHDMPVMPWIGGRNIPDALAVAELLRQYSPVEHVFVEKVWVRPGEGAVGAFTFGVAYGAILGVLAAMKLPYTEVLPQQWQRAAMMAARKDSKMSRVRFTQLWPERAGSVSRVRDHGRADAALIAHAGVILTARAAEDVTGASVGLRPRTPSSGDAPSSGQEAPGNAPGAPPGRTNGPRG